MGKKSPKFNKMPGHREPGSQGSFFTGGTPLRRIFIVFTGAVIFLGVILFLIGRDISRFVGDKALPIPMVAQVDQLQYEHYAQTMVGGLFGESRSQLTLAEANAALTGFYGRVFLGGKKSGEKALRPPVFLADAKGKIVVLFSFPLLDGKFANGAILYGPKAQPLATVSKFGEPMEMSKALANGKELNPDAMKRFSQLIRIGYKQILNVLADRKSHETFPEFLRVRSVRDEPVEVRYVNKTMYFNGYEP